MSGGGDPATVALVPATARAILGGRGWFFKIIRKAIIWVRSCRSWECWKILGEDSSPAGLEGNEDMDQEVYHQLTQVHSVVTLETGGAVLPCCTWGHLSSLAPPSS